MKKILLVPLVFSLLLLLYFCEGKDVAISKDHIDPLSGIWKYNPMDGSEVTGGNNLFRLKEFYELSDYKYPSNLGDDFFSFSREFAKELNSMRDALSKTQSDWDNYIRTMYDGMVDWETEGWVLIKDKSVTDLNSFISKYKLEKKDILATLGVSIYQHNAVNNFEPILVLGAYKWHKFYVSHINEKSEYGTLAGDTLNIDKSNILPIHIDNYDYDRSKMFTFTSIEEKGDDEIFFPKFGNSTKIPNPISEGEIVAKLILIDDLNKNNVGNELFKYRKIILNAEYNKLGGYSNASFGVSFVRFKK